MTLEERLEKYLACNPQIDESAYVDESAVLIGDVKVGPKASIFPCCVLRADINSIEIGEGSNVQDGSVVHLSDDFGVKIGKWTTIGHNAVIHACEIGDGCLIGMSATILDGAKIGDGSIVGAGALVTKNTVVPPGSMVLGSPAKVVKQLDDKTREGLKYWAEKYSVIAATNKKFAAKKKS